MKTVLIVDDHPVFRRGLTVMLEASGYQVVGEAASGEEATAAAAALRPDLVVMDLKLPGLGGIETTAHVLAASPGSTVLIVTMYDDEASVSAGLAAGAAGYVVKDAPPEEIVAALAAVAAGARVIGGGAAWPLRGPGPAPREDAAMSGLTARERSVADLLEKGLPNTAIAGRLGISDKTAANYVANVKAKLGVSSRRDVAAALRRERQPGQE